MNRQHNQNPRTGKNVYVGLSGGVDSAVSAYLLKKTGYNVTGIFIKVWQPEWLDCNWKEERREAMRVAAFLGTPFKTYDAERAYREGVIDYMLSEYRAGRTPNPDVMCNREVKFGAFAKWAIKNGADFVATGHYARVVKVLHTQNSTPNSAVQIFKNHNDNFRLMKGVDPTKDQSYFLWQLTQKDLKHIIFPIGHLKKSEVRKIAQKIGLPNANKKDSQGLCFIGHVDFKDFLAKYINTKPGKVLDISGKEIGHHNGSILFTLGERHGFSITEKTLKGTPLFVISKDFKKNTITVDRNKLYNIVPIEKNENYSRNDEKTFNYQENGVLRLRELNIINKELFNTLINPGSVSKIKLKVQTRYHQKEINAEIVEFTNTKKTTKSILKLRLINREEPASPGQSAVLYFGDECVGGGIIW